MEKLRIRLYEITNDVPESHAALIGSLSAEFPHTIEMVTGSAPIHRYTCAMHAFDLIENGEYINIVHAAPSYVFASPTFVQQLIERGKLIELSEAQVGALVVYSEHGCVKHIGKLIEVDRVESKWGVGHLYRHGLLEVPVNYGLQIRFFGALDKEAALDEFVEYAKEHGVKFQNDA